MTSRSLAPAKITRALWFVAFVLVAIAVGVSVALLVDYLRPAPVFCAAEGGCGRVKLSVYASFHGIPTPALGVGGMLYLAVLLLIDKPWARSLFAASAAAGALFAANLIFQQWHMHAFCVYCMTFDSCMIALAFVGLARVPASSTPLAMTAPDITSSPTANRHSPSPKLRQVAGVLLILVAVGPVVAAKFLKTHVPAPIDAELARTPTDKWTLVDFVDFQCPYCRFTQYAFEPILAKEAGKYRIVRKQVPLTHIHAHALGAAHAETCAEAQAASSPAKADAGDKMAEVLFTLPEEQMDDAHYRDAAGKIGLDVDAFSKCLVDPATQSKIDRDVQTFKDVSGHGLPLLYIGRMRLEGGQDADSLAAAVKEAEADLAAGTH